MKPGEFTLADILDAYASGYFPMADPGERVNFHWYDPELRGQLSIEALHIPRKLEKLARSMPFEITADKDFEGVIRGCAEETEDRPQTWINEGIIALFTALHDAGHAHSVECWKDGALVGGVYGLALGGLFCGESMFSRVSGGSKIALIHLCARLWKGGFTVLDTQFINPHLLQFGAYEISHESYQRALARSLPVRADFTLKKWPNLMEKELLDQYLAQRAPKTDSVSK